MVFYHADTRLDLKAGQILNCNFPLDAFQFGKITSNVSPHGRYYLTREEGSASREWEITLEYVRAMLFPDLPSRFECMFATRSIECLTKWIELRNISQYRIAFVESDPAYPLDASWYTYIDQTKDSIVRRNPSISSLPDKTLIEAMERAACYWRGDRSEYPLEEVLLPFPCKVLEVSDTIFRK